MSIKINVDYQRLESSASRIEQQADAYEQRYRPLFQSVDTMKQGWQGKDNLSFTSQIRGFETDFVKMVTLMRQYAQFLRQSATIYQKTQQERADMARRLTN